MQTHFRGLGEKIQDPSIASDSTKLTKANVILTLWLSSELWEKYFVPFQKD